MGRSLRLSKCGDCCRALAFDLAGYPRKPFDALSQARMDLGHVYAAHALDVLRAEGATITGEEDPVWFCGVLGHIDAFATWPDGRIELVEIKSGGKSSVDDFAVNGLQFARGSFLRQYYAQVQAYLNTPWPEPIDRALVVYCERPDGQAEALASARQLAVGPDPINEISAAGCRIERGYVERSEEAAEIVRRRLRLASQPNAYQDEGLREFALRDDGSLPFECAWCDFGGKTETSPCWGALVSEKPSKTRVARFYPQSELEW